MPTINIASVEGVNAEQSTANKSASTSKPINIASVRATSLHASGLRAASSRKAIDAQIENTSVTIALGSQVRKSADQLSCTSSLGSMASSTLLSYTNSQEPGEDSQLNAFAMVDKLMSLNASLMWQKPELSTVAEQSCMKAPQSNMGLQSLARSADMKTLQDKMGIYDWIDSQTDENGDLGHSIEEQKQMEPGVATTGRKIEQEIMPSANDCSNTVVMAEPASSVRQQNGVNVLGLSVPLQEEVGEGACTPEGSTCFENQKLGGASNVLNSSYERGKPEMMDIGANTQVALEAMDIMWSGKQPYNGSFLLNGKATSYDIGNDTQNAVEAMDILLNSEGDLQREKEKSPLFNIGSSTQMAVDAIGLMRHGIETDVGRIKVQSPPSSFDIGDDTQTAIDTIHAMRHVSETDMGASKVREEIEQGLRAQKLGGEVNKPPCGHYLNEAERALSPMSSTLIRKMKRGVHSKSSTGKRSVVGNKLSSRGSSKTLEKERAAQTNPARPHYHSSKRFLLGCPSTMVPRKKRSHLCGPRSTSHGNIQRFGWQKHSHHLLKPLPNDDERTRVQISASFEPRKRTLSPKSGGNGTEVAVFTVSTNEESARQAKKSISTKPDRSKSLEQSKKRRRCELRSIFVLFSQSLSEAVINQQKKMLSKLGGHVATSAAKATHFVADAFARSRNMLEIMAAGKAVVTTMWLEGCSQAEYFVDENSYLLQDVQREKQWSFCMQSSLAAARRKPLFKGMKVVVSPSTTPDFEAMKAMIESAGGEVCQAPQKLSHSKEDEIASVSFVIGNERDHDFCLAYLKKGCKVYSTELVLHGIVTQILDLSRNLLFTEHVK